MDAQQFNTFMAAFQTGMTALIPAPAAHNPTPKIAVKIPTFKGAPKENVMTWMLQVQNVFKAQGIEDEQKRICYAATGFEDAALQWYLNKVAAANDEEEENTFEDWNTFADELKNSFQPPNYQQYLRRQLKSLRQTNSVQEYASQFRNIMGQVTDMGEPDKIGYFIDGLKPATRMEVSYRSPETFEEAWQAAIKYDTAMFGQGKPIVNYNPPPTKNFSKPTPMELDQAETQRKYFKPNNKKKGNCYNCGKPGHHSRECRSKGKAKVSVIEEQPSTSVPTPTPISTDIEFVHIEENKEQLLRFNGKINGRPAWILLDSGASRNFVDNKFALQHHMTRKNT